MGKIKDLKVYKKILAIMSAFTLMVSPIVGLAEGEEEEKTNEVRIAELLADYETEQMTLEEFKVNAKAFKDYLKPWRNVNPIGTTKINYLYYDLNSESCEDILNDLYNEGIISNTSKYVLSRNLYEVYFSSIDLFQSTKRVKDKIDLSVGIYDQRHKEIYKYLCTPLEEVSTEYNKTKTINTKKLLDCVKKIEKVRESITVQDEACLMFLIRVVTLDMETYVKTKIPEKTREKYLDMKKSADNKYVLKEGIVLDKNSSDECELLIYAHNYLVSLDGQFLDGDILDYETSHIVSKSK